MNFFCVQGLLVEGLQAIPVRVECAQSRRLPYLQILGGSGAAASALRERVIAALGTLGGGKFRLPARRFTVELRPQARSLPLESLDLPVALALLGSAGQLPAGCLDGLLACGRLGLDGKLTLEGPPAAVGRAIRHGNFTSAILPPEGWGAFEEGPSLRGGAFRTLAEAVAYLRGELAAPRSASAPSTAGREGVREVVDPSRLWARISGQSIGLRALEIAAAGAHHLLLSGPAGARADLLAQALSSLLPPLGPRESAEVREIYALAGMGHLVPSCPFHALGSRPELPSLLHDRRARVAEEILLAHHGVLFIDNAGEREALFPSLTTAMREGVLPACLQERALRVPAEAIVVATAAGCACGAAGDRSQSCLCRPTEARRYAARFRRLLRYPFDLFLEVAPERPRPAGESSWRDRAARVQAARQRMRLRQGRWNGRLTEAELTEGLCWAPGARKLWEALESRAAGGRDGLVACARVAATICDLREGSEIGEADLLEALHYFPGAGFPAGMASSASVPLVNSTAIP